MNKYKPTKKPARKPAKKDVSLFWRAGARGFAVAAIFSTVFYGITAGGHIKDPASALFNVQGKVASYFGYAADEIRVAGLKRQSVDAVLKVVDVKLNDSLIGFDPNLVRNVLEKADWVQKAEVRRIYPNKLEIDIVERVPFAIWQRDGEFYVIDRTGAAFTSINAGDVKGLPTVTGEGAHKKVFELVNHMENYSRLLSKIAAAGRVGDRRWNLYLKNGLKVMLPEKGMAASLLRLDKLEKETGIFDKAVASIDLRFADQIVVKPIGDVKKPVKVSQN